MSNLPRDHWRIKLIQWYYRKHTVHIFVAEETDFDSGVWREIETQSASIAERWFRMVDGQDNTVHGGISYGALLRLPIFLETCEELWNTYALMKKIRQIRPNIIIFIGIHAGMRMHMPAHIRVRHVGMNHIFQHHYVCFVIAWLKMLVRFASLKFGASSLKKQQKGIGKEYVFVLAKSLPHDSIVKTLGPVICRLREKNESVAILTFDPNSYETLQKQFPDTSCYDLSRTRNVPINTFLSYAWQLMRWAVRNKHLFESGPLALGEEHISLDLTALTLLLLRQTPYFFFFQHALADLLDERMIIISATETHPRERLVFSCAKQRNIKTVLVQHGVTNETIKNLMVNFPSIASALFVWGQRAKLFFTSHGVPEGRVIISGSPIFDGIRRNQKVRDRNELLHRFKLPNKKLLIFSGQHFAEPKNRALCELVIQAFNILLAQDPVRKDTLALVITPHPARSPHTAEQFYRALINKHRLQLEQDVFIRKTLDIHDLLWLGEMLITSSSTVHVDSALLDRPVILLNVEGVPDMDMVHMGAAFGAHTFQELATAVKTLYSEEGKLQHQSCVNAFLHAYINHPTSATECIVRLLIRTAFV